MSIDIPDFVDEISTDSVAIDSVPAFSEEFLERDLAVVKKIVSISLAITMIVTLGYIAMVITSEGLTSLRPSEYAVEQSIAYDKMVQNNKVDATGKGVKVCIVDSGIYLEHEDLNGYTLSGWKDFVKGKTTPYDDQGHGTSMAGILISSGWFAGVAPDVELYVAKALNAEGVGEGDIVVNAIDWCVSQEVHIISLSLGGAPGALPTAITGNRDTTDAARDAINQGIFVVAAAGNDGGSEDDGDVASPGGEERVICVGGVTPSGGHWAGSSVGDNNGRVWPLPLLAPRSDPHKKPEIVAPAKSVPVINHEGTWSLVDGTSAATVYVTGAIAQLLELKPELQANGTPGSANTIDQVKNWIMESALPYEGQVGHDDNYGYGLLQVEALVEAANS